MEEWREGRLDGGGGGRAVVRAVPVRREGEGWYAQRGKTADLPLLTFANVNNTESGFKS